MTKWLKDVPGDPGNYRWLVTFDYNSDGYLGVTQTDKHTIDRILLSPAQLVALKAFTRRRPRTTR